MTYIEVDPVDGSPDVLEYGLVGHVELPTPHPVLISVIKLITVSHTKYLERQQRLLIYYQRTESERMTDQMLVRF